MAVTQNTYTGNGATVLYSFTFPYLETTDVKVTINGTPTTAYTFANATTIQFNTAPANGAAIRIYRDTDDASLAATFYSGSAIRAQDLNDNFTQNLYVTQEVNNNSVNIDGSNPMVGNLNMNGFQIDNLAAPTSANDAANKAYVDALATSGGDGDKGDITVSGLGSVFTIDNGAITNAKVNASAGIVSSKLAFTQAGTSALQRTVESKLQDVVSVLDFIPDSEHAAIKAGTSTYNATAAIQAAITYANGKSILIPSGTYRVGTITGAKARLIGDGASASRIELATTGSDTILNVNELWVSGLTVSDRGRSSLDHTTNPAVYLCSCTETFDARNCEFLTDRSVLLQLASAQTGYTAVENCSVARVNAPIPSEEDAMNIFVMSEVLDIRFNDLAANELAARSVINATISHNPGNTKHDGVATIEHCRFNYIHNSGGSDECKAIFVQGYVAKVDSCVFVDCFGRCIDVLGNWEASSSEGLTQAGIVSNNKVTYTTTRVAATGFGNDEAGCVYLRYFSGLVIGNVLDFTNLALTSNTYSGIAIRHGYNAVSILSNQIINAKAYCIAVDVSDSIATNNCAAFIAYNRVSSSNSSRAPIIASNDSATKLFSSVVITGNSISYPHTDDIVLGGQIARSITTAFDSVVIENNYSEIAGTYDRVLFRHFPKRLRAPRVSVTVSVDPAGQNLSGVTTSLTDAIRVWPGSYDCLAYTVSLANTVVTTQTITGPISITPLCRTYTVNGDNGASGRIRFYADGTQQTNVSLVLNQNRAVFSGCIFNSDSGTSTTSLIVPQGNGHVQFTNCQAQYGEYFVDSRGPNFSVKGGTVNDINLGNSGARGIIQVSSNNLVVCSIEDTTGANNTRLANLLTPTLLLHENISLGTTAVVKSYTIAV